MRATKVRRKKRLGSYPFLSVIFGISLALFVIGLFGTLLLLSRKLTTAIQENIQIQVYLNKGMTDGETNRIQRIISGKPYVLLSGDRPQVAFISKAEAAKQFVAETGEDFSELLGENPLRDLFLVNVKPGYQSLDSLESIRTEVADMRGIFEVYYAESLVESINQNLTRIGLILSGFAVILLLVVIVLINNTIKLAMFSQRFLIRSMQLVGATNRFIKKPFLLRSALYGAVGGVASCLFLWVLQQIAFDRIPDLTKIYDVQSTAVLYLTIIITGIFVACSSTYGAISRYLKMSLDDLY